MFAAHQCLLITCPLKTELVEGQVDLNLRTAPETPSKSWGKWKVWCRKQCYNWQGGF